jgi:hypothetical protein
MKAFTWILDRLKERSTWLGLVSVLTGAGVSLQPELAEAIITAGAAVAGVVAIATKG